MTSRAITSLKPSPRLAVVLASLIAVLLLAGVFASGGYLVSVFAFAAIDAIFVTGLNLFMGTAGQISFGQSAFAALGGYGSAILCTRYGWEPIPALLAGTIFSCTVAAIVGYPTLRLRGHYLAMATFALGLITYEISVSWTEVTQGYMGIAGIPPLGIFGIDLSSDRQQLAALLAFLALGLFVFARLRRSRFGRALDAIAGSEEAARALGIDVARYKLAAFVIAAAYASVSGSLAAHFIGFISPEIFGLQLVLVTFTMIYLGGIGTVWGPVIGALIVSLLPEIFRGLKDVQDIAYSIALILILIFAPKGLVPLLDRFLRRTGP
jgi:branched-chain amino acid transport system permease protein